MGLAENSANLALFVKNRFLARDSSLLTGDSNAESLDGSGGTDDRRHCRLPVHL